MANNYFGEEFYDSGTRIYLNTRAGCLAETQTIQMNGDGTPFQSDIDRLKAEGYELRYSENKAQQRTYFMAKPRRSISGFVTNMRWFANETKTGVKISGWKIQVETPDKTFVIDLTTKDACFSQLMGIFASDVNFDQILKIAVSMSKGKKYINVFYAGNDKWIETAWKPRFLNLKMKEACKARDLSALTDQDRKNFAYTADGKIDLHYPYITQRLDGGWSSEAFDEHLIEIMQSKVIPAIDAAKQRRGTQWKEANGADVTTPAFSGGDLIGDAWEGPAETVAESQRANLAVDDDPFGAAGDALWAEIDAATADPAPAADDDIPF